MEKGGSRDSSAGTATGSSLEGQGSIPKRGKIFSLLHNVQLTSYPMGTGGLFPESKVAGK
jgi:hypothetical protein